MTEILLAGTFNLNSNKQNIGKSHQGTGYPIVDWKQVPESVQFAKFRACDTSMYNNGPS